MTSYQSHPELETLELHLIGRLPQPESREVEKHLLVCEPCRSMAEALDGQIAALQSALMS